MKNLEGRDSAAPEKDITVRAATPDDQSGIERVAELAYALYVPRMNKKPFPMLDDYGKHIREGHIHALAGQGRILGYVVLLPRADHLLLDNIAVAPDCQGRGYGGILMRFAEEQAKKLGYDRIRLYTNEAMRENLTLYPLFGYEITGRIEEMGYKRVYFQKNLA